MAENRGNGGRRRPAARERERMAYRRKMRHRRRNIQIAVRFCTMIIMVVLLLTVVTQIGKLIHGKGAQTASAGILSPIKAKQSEKIVELPPDYDVQLLTVNEYSRPGTTLEKVNGIVVHYTANPGTTAQQNRNYFEGLKDSHQTSASSHFIIGMEGEIVQCIPCNEIAYASNDRNADTISIECCIPDDTGKFTDETYNTLVHLVAWLCGRYQLTTDDVIRHYDVTGKMCPKYYVENEDAWTQFKADVVSYINDYGVVKNDSV